MRKRYATCTGGRRSCRRFRRRLDNKRCAKVKQWPPGTSGVDTDGRLNANYCRNEIGRTGSTQTKRGEKNNPPPTTNVCRLTMDRRRSSRRRRLIAFHRKIKNGRLVQSRRRISHTVFVIIVVKVCVENESGFSVGPRRDSFGLGKFRKIAETRPAISNAGRVVGDAFGVYCTPHGFNRQ